jgi:hypothetical protein
MMRYTCHRLSTSVDECLKDTLTVKASGGSRSRPHEPRTAATPRRVRRDMLPDRSDQSVTPYPYKWGDQWMRGDRLLTAGPPGRQTPRPPADASNFPE